MINNNKLYPRILLATAGNIGAGLDSPDIYAVCQVNFPISLFVMAQELGRCGRGRLNECTVILDSFHMYLTLDNFVYLNQRLYLPRQNIASNITPILTIEHEQKL